MKTKTAIMRQAPGQWEVVEVDLDGPRQGELLVKMVASGLCHSDDHIATGDLPMSRYPTTAGHEGAGVVVEVGPNTPGWEVGDHVVLSFIPGCGTCRFCGLGMGNLCDNGAGIMSGMRPDGSYKMHLDGEPVAQMSGIATFSAWSTVSTMSAVKIPKDIPLDRACLVGCGVATGFGSATNTARVQTGDTVIVMGVGGIGINAVQGAALSGAANVVAVDPVEFKREKALELGATQAFASIAEAAEFARSATNGQGADSAIVCVGVTTGEHLAQAFDAIRKGGAVVATGIGNFFETGIPVSPTQLTLFQKRLLGSLYGEQSPSVAIPKLLNLYRAGKLRLDELVTRTYRLEEINQGYADMHEGLNLRGVIIHEH